jgi:heme exporter protein D
MEMRRPKTHVSGVRNPRTLVTRPLKSLQGNFMDNPLLWQIILGVVVLAALVLGGLSTKTWRAWDVVAGFLVVLTAIAFLILVSASLKTRRTWLQQVARLQQQYDTLRNDEQRLLHGDLTETVQVEPSLRSERYRLTRLLIDRGRVWRSCTPGNPDQGIVPVQVIQEVGDSHQIPQNMVLHAFREAPIDDEGTMRVPAAYIGEFRVTAINEAGVMLRPTRQLSPVQVAQLGIAGATWSLYEKIPSDSQRLFTDPDTPPELQREGAPIFGEVNEEELTEVFQFVQDNLPAQGQLSAERLQEVVGQFLRSGSRATEGDSPDTIQLKVRFLQEHAVQVDTNVAQGALSSRPFDASGLAQVEYLQRDDEDSVTIQPGAIVVLTPSVANPLIQEGVCELVEPIYVRPLTNFSLALNRLYHRRLRNTQIVEAVRYNTGMLSAAKEKIDQQTIYRQQERTRVEEDLEKLKFEREQITQLAEAVTKARDDVLDRLRSLFTENLRLAQSLETFHRETLERMDREYESVTTPR